MFSLILRGWQHNIVQADEDFHIPQSFMHWKFDDEYTGLSMMNEWNTPYTTLTKALNNSLLRFVVQIPTGPIKSCWWTLSSFCSVGRAQQWAVEPMMSIGAKWEPVGHNYPHHRCSSQQTWTLATCQWLHPHLHMVHLPPAPFFPQINRRAIYARWWSNCSGQMWPCTYAHTSHWKVVFRHLQPLCPQKPLSTQSSSFRPHTTSFSLCYLTYSWMLENPDLAYQIW